MTFLIRHWKTWLIGIWAGAAEFMMKLMPQDFSALMGAVLTLSATLTAIFIGFISILLSFRENELFKSMNLDLKILEGIMLGTFFYLIVSFESIFGFFISPNQHIVVRIFMAIWVGSLTWAFCITTSLMKDLALILHGQWARRENEKTIYPDDKGD